MAEIYKAGQVLEEINDIPTRPIEIETEEDAGQLTADALNNARDEGYQAGFTDGFYKGALQEKAQLLEQSSTLNGLITSIPTAINANRLQQSSEIANIVLAITAQLFSQQQQDKNAITRQVTQIIEQLNEAQHIDIALHPQDWDTLQKSGFTETMKHYPKLQFTPNEQLRLGGCVVSSEHGVFDASIERQIDNLKQVLLQMKHEAGHD